MADPQPQKPSRLGAVSENVFREIEIIRDPDGPIAVITERERDGRVSFMLSREFESGGKTQRTSFLKRHHIAAIRRLLNDLEEKLDLAEDRTRAKRR